MTELKAMVPVYCYNFPEVRKLLHEVEQAIPDEIYQVTASAEKVRQGLEGLFEPELEIPETIDGCVDLDEIHVPIIDRIVEAYAPTLHGLEQFRHRYPTSGSSEGLFHLLARYATRGIEEINVLDGEYEGYEAQARNLGMDVRKHTSTQVYDAEPGLWFISNPSARDGNIITNDFLNMMCRRGHELVLDLSYVGATAPHEYDLSHPNIVSVVMSFSKPYGVFRHRIGGFTFSKPEIPSLYGNKWFKDTLRLMQALKIAEDMGPVGPNSLYEKYRPVQEEIIRGINDELELCLEPSDSLLIANVDRDQLEFYTPEQQEMIKPFKRGNNYRLCLTPYFEMKEMEVGT
ncbi:MAG: hypothetical protein KJ709_09020 [Nanoarchaeota archaeon]|nr:hypothetical protein [Nanoarchaeota archaeon]